jgi:hypothetical protein
MASQPVPATAQIEDLARRLMEVEEMARANRRELELQFRRIADMQVEIDRLSRRKTRKYAR